MNAGTSRQNQVEHRQLSTGTVLTDIHPTPDGPRYATRKDFVYGEDVTIGDWTISTDDLPRYKDQPSQPQP